MFGLFFSFLLILLSILNSPKPINAETAMDFYMSDFYSKTNEASEILKKIESDLKKGSRVKVCARQREAARLGLLANKSLIKAFELEGAQVPIDAISANQKRWNSILSEC